MPQFAYFDSTAAQPTPVIGWYDTDAIAYPNPPKAADLLELDPAQWEARMEQDWSVSAGTLVPTVAPVIAPTPAQVAFGLLSRGLTLTCTSNSALNGTYTCTPDDISDIQAQFISILDGGVFTNGLTTRTWPDAQGDLHEFNIPQFRAFGRAMAVFVDACKSIITANSGTPPSNQAAIP